MATAVNFNYTGSRQDWTVPNNVFSVTIECWGAQGGGSGGGKGGYAKGKLTVTPGSVLRIYTGGRGGKSSSGPSSSVGGWPFGGAGGTPRAEGSSIKGGGGGGCSEVRTSTSIADRKIVAGGGGGQAHDGLTDWPAVPGGHGGASTGGTGASNYNSTARGGTGGVNAGPWAGHGGIGVTGNGSAGFLETGGKGGGSTANNSWMPGGGGGGGYYGGGGGGGGALGGGGAGGGGTNYTGGVTSTVSTRGVRTGDGLVRITYSATPPLSPTNVKPVAGSTQQTDNPTLALSFKAHPGGSVKQKAQWQLATNSGMSTGLITATQPDSQLAVRADGSTVSKTLNSLTGQILTQGIWYIRARSIDEYGNVSAWTTVHSFSVSHPPATTSHSPTGGQTLDYGSGGDVLLSWTFTDPSSFDDQTAYRIEISRNDTGAVIHDTGKIIGEDNEYLTSIDSALKDITLRWRVKVWDRDDVESNMSSYQLFRVMDLPTIAITSPSNGSTIDVASPTIRWSFSASASRVQTRYQVRITEDATGVVIYNSGLVDSSDKEHAITSVLENLTNYTVSVTSRDNYGLSGTASASFSTNWVPAPQPDFKAVNLVNIGNGYVSLRWDNSLAVDDFVSWNVYRRVVGGAWSQIAEFSDPLNEYVYRDWLVAVDNDYEYSVTQSSFVFGSLVESPRTVVKRVSLHDDHYWLIAPNHESLNVRLSHVTEESINDDVESEVVHVLGRGRHVDYGDDLGYSGTLTVQLRTTDDSTAREKRQRIEAIRKTNEAAYLRNPFGDLWQVSVQGISFDRIPGRGSSEDADVSIPYVEVA